MSKSWKKIIVSAHLIGRMNNRLKCKKCDIEFKLNEKIMRHIGNSGRGHKVTRYYCLSCYEGLWI